MDIVYGIPIRSMDDEYIKVVVEAMEVLGESKHPARYWVNYMPFLRFVPAWVPGAASAKLGVRSRPNIDVMVNRPFDTIRGGEVRCILQSHLRSVF